MAAYCLYSIVHSCLSLRNWSLRWLIIWLAVFTAISLSCFGKSKSCLGNTFTRKSMPTVGRRSALNFSSVNLNQILLLFWQNQEERWATDLSMREDLPTPASPSTSTFRLTRLSKIFSKVMFVIGCLRHSHLSNYWEAGIGRLRNHNYACHLQERLANSHNQWPGYWKWWAWPWCLTCTVGKASYWKSMMHRHCDRLGRSPKASWDLITLIFISLSLSSTSQTSHTYTAKETEEHHSL